MPRRMGAGLVMLACLGAGVAAQLVVACVGDDPDTAPESGGVDANVPNVDANGGSDAGVDTGSDDGSTTTDGGRCDVAKKFGAPVFVAGIDVGKSEFSAHLSADELRIVFASNRGNNGYHLYSAARADTAAAFADAGALPGLATGGVNDFWGTFLSGSPTLYFCTTRPGNTAHSIYASTPDDAGTYGTPVHVAALDSAQESCHVHAARHAQELWFSGADNNGDIMHAPALADGGFGSLSTVTELQTGTHDFAPVLSDDGLTIYWASNRTDKTSGMDDIWSATRADKNAVFGNPHNVEELNSAGNDWPSWLSTDLCRLYLVSTRSGRSQIYVATRSP